MATIDAHHAGGPNAVAFLDLLAVAEIGPALLADPASDHGYRVLVGSTPERLTVFADYRGHPIPDDADAIEYAPGRYSTAAGRYQILNTYWPHYRDRLGLADFGPESQDRYALAQIQEQGAAPLIASGQIASAVRRCANIWASLPGAGYGQRERAMPALLDAYGAAGGVCA